MGTCPPLSKHWSTIMKLKLRHWFKPMTGEVINVDYIEAQWVALFPTSAFMEALSQIHRGLRHPNMLMPDTTGHPQSFFLSVSWQVGGVSGSWSVSHWRNTAHMISFVLWRKSNRPVSAPHNPSAGSSHYPIGHLFLINPKSTWWKSPSMW